MNILDIKTGVCLFEQLFKWKGQSSTEGVCKLILTFTKISRDIGDNGVVHQVFFEPINQQPATRERAFSTGARYQQNSIRNKSHGSEKVPEAQGNIQLTCAKDENVIIATFHEADDSVDLVRKYVNGVLGDWVDEYGKKVKEMRDIFDSMVDEKREKLMSYLQVLDKFKDFQKTVKFHAKNFVEVQTEIAMTRMIEKKSGRRRGSSFDEEDLKHDKNNISPPIVEKKISQINERI